MTTVHDFTAKRLGGDEEPLSRYKGKTLLIVNVASQCGFTPQYAGLQALHERFAGRGFEVLGFPCNQFGGQEPGEETEIAAFYSTTYGVTFPMYAKIDVNGEGAHPLYKFMKAEKKGIAGSTSIKWNFTKFLVSGDGDVVARFGPQDAPEAISKRIEAML